MGGQPPGNIRIRIRNVSWIQSNLGFSEALKPAFWSIVTQRLAVGMSGLSL